MLSASVDPASGRFTRSDAWRLLAASAVLVLAMSVILGLDILPAQATLVVDKPASTNVVAPRAAEYTSDVLTERQRAAARDLVEPQYDFTIAQGAAIAAQQVRALDRKVAPIEAAFADTVKPEDRATLLAAALPSELREADRATLTGLDAARWLAVRTEAARVLDTLERSELRDTEVPLVADGVESRFAGDLTEPETALGAALIRPLIVGNSSFSVEMTAAAKSRAAEGVKDVTKQWERGETIVRAGDRVDEVAWEAIDAFGQAVAADPNLAAKYFQ